MGRWLRNGQRLHRHTPHSIAQAAAPTQLFRALEVERADSSWRVFPVQVGRGEFAYLVAQTAQEKLLNPALDSFTADTDGLRLMSGGYYCVDLNLDGACVCVCVMVVAVAVVVVAASYRSITPRVQ